MSTELRKAMLKRIIVTAPFFQAKGKGVVLKEDDTLEKLKSRIKIEIFPDSCLENFCLECNGAEIFDLEFLRDLDQVNIVTTNNDAKENDDVTNTELVNPNASQTGLTGKAGLRSRDEWITLNVGGTRFLTCRSTLVMNAAQTGMLARMFCSEEGGMLASHRDADGAYLIDRNPKYFGPILNYLRTGRLIIDHNVNVEGVYEEAKFFGVDHLMPQLENMLSLSQMSLDDTPLTRREVVNAIIVTASNKELRFQGVNLSGADLSKLDLRNINFKYAIFKSCNLKGANLSYCNFERADFSHAILDGALLLGVRMVCANMEKASMQKCTFDDPAGYLANMEGVNLRSANMEGSNMAGVNLRVATIKHGNMQNCDLRGAVLAGADLEQCNLSGSDLQDANLRGANLKDTTLEFMMTPLHMSQTIR